MDQGTFDFKPRTRATDPATSHRAETHARTSGVMRNQRDAALWLVELYGPATATELAALSLKHPWASSLGTDVISRRYALCRRLPELEAVRAEDAPYRRERTWRLLEHMRRSRMDTKACCGAPYGEECYGRCSSRNQEEE